MEKKKVLTWVNSLPSFFASCGIPDSMNMAKDLVELLRITPDVVRCKDCKHFAETQMGFPREEQRRYVCDEFNPPDDWFCADGVAKDINDALS